uniref:Cystatin domain-containing protein n=1 Tax=Amphilophus citrinellus TaxID=61819 RepID=A0A3Q0SYF4_AMPCI
MRTLHVLTLLLSAVLLCSAAPALGPVTCSEGKGSVTAHVALHHINEQHDHGYKFRLHEVQGNKVDGGCNVELQLELRETKCHTINPKPFEDCEIREEHERAVMANCTVLMTVKDGDANITKYQCDTKQGRLSLCPDCPILIPLNNSEGLRSIREAVNEFNKNTSNQRYYILKEVGRILSGVQGIFLFLPLFLSQACTQTHTKNKGPPPHACDHGHGPPPHARDHGHGPPPHAHGKCSPFRRHFRPCHGFLANPDPALHPICPWPLPHPKHTQS